MGCEQPLLRMVADELIGITVDAIANAVIQIPEEAPMPATAHIVHHVPGRVRVRVPHKRGHHEFFADVERRLSQAPNITGVHANPTTGSLLVRYSGELTTILGQAAAVGLHELLDFDESLPPVKAIEDALSERLLSFDAQILETTGGTIGGRSAVLVTLLIAALVQLWRGQAFGPALPLIWYAAQALGFERPKVAGAHRQGA
jgi:hypothetical protein